nr:lysine exporter LysO family protein [Vibrio sp. S9_S30]
MFIGYLIKVSDKNRIHHVGMLSRWLVKLILFVMGVSVTNLDNFGSNIAQVATISSVFMLCIGGCFLILFPRLERWHRIETKRSGKEIPLAVLMKDSGLVLGVVILGGVVGIAGEWSREWLNFLSESILVVLLLLIGIELRNSGLTLKQIILNRQGLTIALFTVLISWLGGLLGAVILGLPILHGMAMGSGFGWYSLSGILIGEGLGPVFGSAALVVELGREIASILLIGFAIHRYPATSIGYAGATAMDFTLPVIQSYGGIKTVPISIVSGFVLSLLVPILIPFFLYW